MSRKTATVRRVGLVLALVLSAAAGASATAPNLVVNGTFDTDLAGWSVNPTISSWDPDDAAGSQVSGSLRAVLADGPITFIAGGQCIPVTPGQVYTLSGSAKVPAGQPGTGFHTIGIIWHEDSTCGFTNAVFADSITPGQTPGAWGSGAIAVSPPPGVLSATVDLTAGSDSAATFTALFDDIRFEVGNLAPPCTPTINAACLTGDRFEVVVIWERPDGTLGLGTPVKLGDDSVAFWFFRPDNIELIVKVIDACVPAFDRFWVFAAGLTNVRVDLIVTDKLTDESRTYVNPVRQAYQPVQDTDAFATCP